MNSLFRQTVTLALVLTAAAHFAHSQPSWPLQVGTGQRLLVDQTGTPFLIQGDAPWSIIVATTREEAELYLEDRRQRGFNALVVNLIEHKEGGASNTFKAPRNRYGDAPFITSGDFSTPNEAYFAHADWIISRAASKGMVVLLAPCYLGWAGSDEGWYQEVLNNGDAKCRSYGRYVGARYRLHPNIIWVMSGDRDPGAARTMVDAMAAGILEEDNTHLMMAHCAPETNPRSAYSGSSWMNLNNVYTYNPVQIACITAYTASPALPFLMFESAYEGSPYAPSQARLRAQAYMALLSGACGQVFGNYPIWYFGSGWTNSLGSGGAVCMGHVSPLFRSRNWPGLVPDLGNQVITAGNGTGAASVGCARTQDGRTVIAYLPDTAATITINMSMLSGSQTRAHWYDPRNGTASVIGLFANSGTRSFTRPDSSDWVLVLDDASIDFPPPGQLPPTLSITTSALPQGTVGAPYSVTLSSTGGVRPHVWSLNGNMAQLPSGLSLSSEGLIQGTPASASSTTIGLRVVDATGMLSTVSLALTVNAAEPTPPAAPTGLQAGPAN